MGSPYDRGDTNPAAAAAHLVERLGRWQADAADGLASLRADRLEVEASAGRLESPRAVHEHIDFFAAFFTRTSAVVEQVSGSLALDPCPEHARMLEHVAAEALEEERRSGSFRDKWINRPLPDERVRPLLVRVATTVRDRLAAHRDLLELAERVRGIAAPSPESASPDGRLGRRALFTRLLRPLPGRRS
jgi:hypothetical protein